MALIKLGPAVADIRGKIGGTIFSRSRSGATARAFTSPVQPVSSKRAARNAAMSLYASAWQRTLSTAERALWNERAAVTQLSNRLGESYKPTGMNLYVRANAMLDLTGQAAVDTPPDAAVAPGLFPTLAVDNATGIRITSLNGFDLTNTGSVYVQRSTAMYASRSYHKGPWAVSSTVTTVALGTLPLLVTPVADLLTSSRYFYRFVFVMADGAVSFATIQSIDTPASFS